GASPRASLALIKAAQALALLDGGAFLLPEHVQELAVPVIAHRLVVDSQARFSGVTAQGLVEEIVKKVPVPAGGTSRIACSAPPRRSRPGPSLRSPPPALSASPP